MLEAIADFWKPVKRLAAQAKLKVEDLQVGSTIGFGLVPQPTLSGRRLTVTAINTYKFGTDILTSFVLSQEKDAGVSIIVAETGGDQYIAISRRISMSDRNKLFSHEEIEALITSDKATQLNIREITPDYKGWLATHYKREITRVKGQLYKGDFRLGLLTGQTAMDFTYTLLVSDNNEHALEIEKYEDGRIEIHATVYRRMSDVGEVVHPQGTKETLRPDVRLVSGGEVNFDAPAKAAPKLQGASSEAAVVVPEQKPAPTFNAESKVVPKETKPEPRVEAKAEPVKEAPEPVVEARAEIVAETKKTVEVQEEVASKPITLPEFPASQVANKHEEELHIVEPEILAPLQAKETQKPTTTALSNDSDEPEEPMKISMIIQPNSTQPYVKQEITTVNKEISTFVNESIDCELQVANKIIDEAIRNEMRINDVVRRVIGLPVSQQESVQIPVTLTDQDYALLAIRYGISASDHEAIKKRIIEDLGDFSGASRLKKAA